MLVVKEMIGVFFPLTVQY